MEIADPYTYIIEEDDDGWLEYPMRPGRKYATYNIPNATSTSSGAVITTSSTPSYFVGDWEPSPIKSPATPVPVLDMDGTGKDNERDLNYRDIMIAVDAIMRLV